MRVLTPDELDQLEVLLKRLTLQLKKLGAPRTTVTRATEAQGAIDYARRGGP